MDESAFMTMEVIVKHLDETSNNRKWCEAIASLLSQESKIRHWFFQEGMVSVCNCFWGSYVVVVKMNKA